ncbi:MAG: family 10 glycosylhydrolase [Thermoguttaceae bacterium]
MAIVFFTPLVVMAEEVRLRIAWGGGLQRQWQGNVTLSEGRFVELKPLGIEADEPGSMYLVDEKSAKKQRLVIQQRSSRVYDGFDVLVDAPPTARMVFQLIACDSPEQGVKVEAPLADALDEFVNKELDAQGNRLLATRAPGDQLRVIFSRDSLVFAPGETFRFMVEPRLLSQSRDTKIRLKADLCPAGTSKVLWSSQCDVQNNERTQSPIELPIPDDEGVYDVRLNVSQNSAWTDAVRRPLSWNKTIVERKMQLLVLDPRGPAGAKHGGRVFSPVVEIDPANQSWWELPGKLSHLQLSKPWLAWKGPPSSGNLKPYHHPLGELVQLSGNADSKDVSWEAYWLPISHPGRPHILEVEYPSDVPQTLGISIIEPNTSASPTSISLDSGVEVHCDGLQKDASPRMLRQRLIFWPCAPAPLLLMTNGRDHSPAVYGKIRVLSGGRHLPDAGPLVARRNQRLIAAYFDRPLFTKNFSACETYDQWCGRSLDDWNTFYEGGTRLVEYLRYVGYNGLMLNVLADGSTIYPSALLQPTPRYDTGVYFSSGQDPVRKDVLEMLFRIFDRERMRLIPCLEFAAPLPELETIRRQGGTAAKGLQWIGPDGNSWCAAHPEQHGLAPYYNVLNPRVQEAMLNVLAEVAERYAQHPSFAGIGVQLSHNGYAQLPDAAWGMDDLTIKRFTQQTGVNVPGQGRGRFAKRAAFLTQENNRQVWLEWRAKELKKFYAKAQKLLGSLRTDSRLFLSGTKMIGGVEVENELKPSLSRQTTMANLLLQLGFDAQDYRGEDRIVLLRPEYLIPSDNLAEKALQLQLSQLPDVDRYFQAQASPGSLFFHLPREMRIPSFDRKSPIKLSSTTLFSQPSPSGAENRRRFAHSLAALDVQTMFDGGWMLPMGQEDSTRKLAVAYRSLPAIRFQQVDDCRSSSQPVVFRVGHYGNRTYLYAVNDAPFGVAARVNLNTQANCTMEELSGLRKVNPLKTDANGQLYWEVNLDAYDMAAVCLNEPNIQASMPQVTLPKHVAATLASEIILLGARTAALRSPRPLKLLENADFEKALGSDKTISNWSAKQSAGASIEIDRSMARSGKQSLHISSNGPTACLESQAFAAPRTGRLSMSVWLRVADPQRQPMLRLAFEGKLYGRDYFPYAPVGRMPDGRSSSVPLGTQWTQYIFQVDDLPLEGVSSLRARFDLSGPGEVWIDDVQFFDLAFSGPEIVELSKIITLADVKLQNGQLNDCLQLLGGYWPRFLEEHVSLPSDEEPSKKNKSELADQPASKPTESDSHGGQTSNRTGFFGRIKNMLPEKLRF